jgi:spore maturation protein CgeB
MTKVLVCGGTGQEIYEKSIYQALKKTNGLEVDLFDWSMYLSLKDVSKISFQYFTTKLQNKYSMGSIISQINVDLMKKVENNKYDLVFIYRGQHILPETIKTMQFYGSIVFIYNNDNPFSAHYPKYFWRHFLQSAIVCDHVFSYRVENIEQYKLLGQSNVSLLRSYYLKEYNFFINPEKFESDVIFIGHYEKDGRDEILKHLIENNIKTRIYGWGWEGSNYFKELSKYGKIRPVFGKEYNEKINKSKIALVFLSKINRDTYTRRCFEILATKTLMLSEYTRDLASLFKPNIDAIYYTNKNDCLEKIKYLINNKNILNEVSKSGYQKLITGNHSVNDRAKEIIKIYKEIK